MTRSKGCMCVYAPAASLCTFSCPFLICCLLLCWACGADQLLYLHILPSLCFQSLQPQLINAVERRQMKRRAEGSETRITAVKVSARKQSCRSSSTMWGSGRILCAKCTSHPSQCLTKSQNNSARNLINPHFQVQVVHNFSSQHLEC